MNRRQFLTGVSAAAVATVLPAAASPTIAWDLAAPGSDRVAVQEIYWRGRRWWINGIDNVVHFSEPCDPDCWVDLTKRYKETERAMRATMFPIEPEDCDDVD